MHSYLFSSLLFLNNTLQYPVLSLPTRSILPLSLSSFILRFAVLIISLYSLIAKPKVNEFETKYVDLVGIK